MNSAGWSKTVMAGGDWLVHYAPVGGKRNYDGRRDEVCIGNTFFFPIVINVYLM